MKKKITLIMAILCIAAVAQAHAFGVGAQMDYNMEEEESGFSGFSVVLSFSERFHLLGNWDLDGPVNRVGLAMDYYPLRVSMINSGALRFYLGFGLSSNIFFADNIDTEFDLGLRLPVGLSLFLGRNIEFYTNIAPSLGFAFAPFEYMGFSYPIAVGARIWFRSPRPRR